jgi:hypothetical protein
LKDDGRGGSIFLKQFFHVPFKYAVASTKSRQLRATDKQIRGWNQPRGRKNETSGRIRTRRKSNGHDRNISKLNFDGETFSYICMISTYTLLTGIPGSAASPHRVSYRKENIRQSGGLRQ